MSHHRNRSPAARGKDKRHQSPSASSSSSRSKDKDKDGKDKDAPPVKDPSDRDEDWMIPPPPVSSISCGLSLTPQATAMNQPLPYGFMWQFSRDNFISSLSGQPIQFKSLVCHYRSNDAF